MNFKKGLILATLLLMVIPQSAVPVLAQPSSSQLQLGQTVSGVLDSNNSEDWFGIHLPRGGYNITLQVSSSADLAFKFSVWVQGLLTASLGGNWITQDTGGIGSDESLSFALPQASQLGLLPPGDYTIVVYGSVLGAYNLTVRQTQTYTALSLDTPQTFQQSSSGFSLFSYQAQATDVYNLTLRTNNTAVSSLVAVFEDEAYIPAEFSILASSVPSLLLSANPGILYFQVMSGLGPGPGPGAVQGNVTISRTLMPSLVSGQTIPGTLDAMGVARYRTPLQAGSYYNFTLEVPSSADLKLELWTPSEPTFFPPSPSPSPAAWSDISVNGVDEKIVNFAIFQFSSYAVSASGGYQSTRGDGPFGVSPSKVIVKVSGQPRAAFNLTLTSTPFPVLAPDSPRAVSLNSGTGPYYQFYRTSSAGPASYNVTMDYEVRGSTPGWASEVRLASPVYLPRTFQPSLLFETWQASSFFSPDEYRGIARSWVIETGTLADAQLNQDGSSVNRTLQIPLFSIPHSDPVYIAVVGSFGAGSSQYMGTLVYHSIPAALVSVGQTYSSRIQWPETHLYKVNLVGGHTYKVSVNYTSADMLWAVYDSSGLLEPSLQPIFWVFLVSDINYPGAGDELFIRPTASGTYYLASSISLTLGPTPAPSGMEGDYSFVLQEFKPPSLDLTLTPPISTEIGQAYHVDGTIGNTGSMVAENVVVSLTLPDGATSAEPSSLNIGDLQPGGVRSLSWTLTSERPGEASLVLEASSNNGPAASVSSRVTVLSPLISIQLEYPPSAEAGTSFTVRATITNNGDGPARNLVADVTLPSGMDGTNLVSSIGDVGVGETKTASWTLTATASGQFNPRVTVSGPTVSEQQDFRIESVAPLQPAPVITSLGFAVIVGAAALSLCLGLLIGRRGRKP